MSMIKYAFRWLAPASICIAGSLLLSACVQPQQQAQQVPGQKLTWAEQHAIDVANYQKLGEDRKQDRPCRLKGCS